MVFVVLFDDEIKLFCPSAGYFKNAELLKDSCATDELEQNAAIMKNITVKTNLNLLTRERFCYKYDCDTEMNIYNLRQSETVA